MRRFKRHLRKDEQGLAVVEFVAMLPLFLLFLTFFFYFSQLYTTIFIANFVTYDGSRAAMALGSTASDGEAKSNATLHALPFKFQSTSVSCKKDSEDTSCTSTIEIPLILKAVGMPNTVHRTIVLPTEKPL